MERLVGIPIPTPKAIKCLENKTVIFSRKDERRFVIMQGRTNLKLPFQLCVLDHTRMVIKILSKEGNAVETSLKGTEYLEFTPSSPVLTHK